MYHLPLPYFDLCPSLHMGNWLLWETHTHTKWIVGKSQKVLHLLHVVAVCVFTNINYISTSSFCVCPQVFTCLCVCTGTPGIVFMSVYLGESTDTLTMELILLGMRLGSCCTALAVVLLFWSVPWSFLLQRDSWVSNMIHTTNYNNLLLLHSQVKASAKDLIWSRYTKDPLKKPTVYVLIDGKYEQ